jgi:hypothetical protein
MSLTASWFAIFKLNRSPIFSNAWLKGMAEIVDECRSERLVHPSVLRREIFLDHFHQPPSRVENADAMEQPRVSSARIDKVRKSELLDAPEPLKRASLDHAPKHVLQLRPLNVEFDKVVQWIANPLLLGHPTESSR